MTTRTVFVISAFLLFSTIGCGQKGRDDGNLPASTDDERPLIPNNEDVVRDYLGAPALEILRGAGTWEMFSLRKTQWINWHREDETPGLMAEAEERLSDAEFSLGNFALEDTGDRQEFLKNLYEAIDGGTGPRDCFYPTYALRVQGERGKIIILLCSLCGCVAVLNEDSTRIGRRPIPEFKEFFDYLDMLLKSHEIASSR